MWTAIAVTCRYDQHAIILQKELDSLQEKGVFPGGIPVIVVEDPSEDIGSGGSTLNALLVVAEHISAKLNQTVLSVDLLQSATILIIHLGAKFHLEPCGRAFFSLGSSILTDSEILVPANPLIHLYTCLTRKLGPSLDRPGVWVAGSDAFFTIREGSHFSLEEADLVAFTAPVDPAFAKGHGVYKLDQNGMVEDIVYQGSEEEIASCSLEGDDDRVPLVLALLYISVPVAESLLLLHSAFPLTCSTYLGIDSGGIGLKLSLFFDFLLPTCKKVRMDDFIGGNRAGSMGKGLNARCEQRAEQLQLMPKARRSLWDALEKYHTKAVVMETEFYHYMSNDETELGRLTDFLEKSYPFHNSVLGQLEKDVLPRQRKILTSSSLSCNLMEAFQDKRDQTLERYWKLIERVLMDDKDVCILPLFRSLCIDLRSTELLARMDTYEQFVKHEVSEFSMEWNPNVKLSSACGCALSAQPHALDRVVQHSDSTPSKTRTPHVSQTAHLILAGRCGSTRIIGRTFSCVADILGILAKGEGGLRSGPAANIRWKQALALLEGEDIEKGVRKLGEIRKEWMSSPTLLIRAARHYEAAAQIFIRKTVMNVDKLIRVEKADGWMAECGKWTVCRAAVRMDVGGGWSDTPPITYENGGAVFNIAIKVDGKKPVGARCRITKSPNIKVTLGSGDWRQDLVLETLDDIKCYSNPSSPGSLICAVIVCAKLVRVDEGNSLEDELGKSLGGAGKGLEVHCWSNLPQGSGLGTSSILAGCILVAIWNASGHKFDTDALLHAILYVEQLLTTGGGWQDQVGGLVPGVKIGRFGRTEETARITYETVHLTEEQRRHLEDTLLLVYTGRTRLAKNLLQEVIRNWYSRQRDVVETVIALVKNAEFGKSAADRFDVDGLAECAKEYWNLKKRMAPGCEPKAVGDVLDALYRKGLIKAGWMAGAGGGGYLYLLTREPKMSPLVQAVINQTVPGKGMTIHSVVIDMEPMKTTFEY